MNEKELCKKISNQKETMGYIKEEVTLQSIVLQSIIIEKTEQLLGDMKKHRAKDIRIFEQTTKTDEK